MKTSWKKYRNSTETVRHLVTTRKGVKPGLHSFLTGNTSLIAGCIAFLFMLSWGCEKVIDVDLNDSEPATVIEGNLSYTDGKLEVKISKSGSYFNPEPAERVENAEVFLDRGPGFHLTAQETGAGVYTLTDLPLNINTLYRLTVKVDEEEYKAMSRLSSLVPIDSIDYEYQPEQAFFDGGYRILVYFKDPAEEENYYRIKIFRNREQVETNDNIIVLDDGNMDGKHIRVRMRSQLFDEGDTARVELYSIDKNAWEYFSTLEELINLNPGSPAPANPVSNLSNGALGYFSAWSLSAEEMIIGK